MEAPKASLDVKAEYIKCLKAELTRVSDELYEHDISAMKLLAEHIRSKLRRDEKTGRMMKADIK